MSKIKNIAYSYGYPFVDKFKSIIQQRKFMKYYYNSQDEEINEIKKYVCSNHYFTTFNYPFVEKYNKINIDICKDETCNMYYVLYNDHKMYFKRDMSRRDVFRYVQSLMIEQDPESPHRYLSETFSVDEGSIIVDAGVAEGNFSLEAIDKAKKIVLVECDAKWIEALEKTFCKELRSGKVEIISKKLGKNCSEDTISLNYIYQKYNRIDFVKMDIEGAEQDALTGGRYWMASSGKKRLAVCTYHTPTAYDEIYAVLKNEFIVEHTNGYMCLNPLIGFNPPYLRRGVIRAYNKVDS